MNANSDIDTINQSLSEVIADLMTNMTAEERHAEKKGAVVYSAGAQLDASLRRAIMSGCTAARAEAAHLTSGDGAFQVELFTRSGGKLKSVRGLVIVRLDDGRTAAATKDGRAIYTVVDGKLKRQPCSIDMTTAAPKGLEALMAQVGRRSAAKTQVARVTLRHNMTDVELGLSPIDADDEEEDIRVRRLIKLLHAYFDVTHAAIVGNNNTPRNQWTIHFAGGAALNDAASNRFCQNIGPEHEGLWLDFGDKITEGPVEVTVIANRRGVHYAQSGCRPWRASADAPLVFTFVSASGRKSHFACDGQGGLEQEEGHPAVDLSDGYEIARRTLANAAVRALMIQDPELLKQAA